MGIMKKSVAVAIGVVMLVATVMGGLAANLGDYPRIFILDNSFDGALVVGDRAAAEDVVGAIDIATGIQVQTEGTIESIVEGEAIKIETDTNKLNIGDNLTEVKTVALDEDDLPTILADGTYRNDAAAEFDYEQKIVLDSGLEFAHWSDSDYEDKEPTLGIKINKNDVVMTYTLDFTKSAESEVDENDDLEDFEDTSIVMLGKTYDIVEADNATNVKLELMSGAVKDVMEQGQIKTFTVNGEEYEVEVTYIGGATTSEVKFKINGELTKALPEDATHKLSDGTQIGVREILEEEAGEVTNDQVEFYLGVEKLTLEDNQNLEVNEDDIDEITVNLDTSFGAKTLINKIELIWTADDDLFVTEDSEITMPGLESVKIIYEGLVTDDVELTTISPSGDKVIELSTTIKSGDVVIELLGSNGTAYTKIGGEDVGEGLRTVAGESQSMVYNATSDQYFVATYFDGGAAGESYLLEVKDIDDVDGVDLEDASGTDYLDKKTAAFTVGSVTLTLSNINETTNTVTITGGANTYFDRIVTEGGLMIYLPVDGTNIDLAAPISTYVFTMEEEDKDGGLTDGSDINVTLGHTADSEVSVKSYVETILSGGQDYEIGDSETYIGYVESDLGTKIVFDADDNSEMEISYYGKSVYGNVYVSASDVVITTTSSSTSEMVSIPPALLASEIVDEKNQNLVLVGGPCANPVTAEVLGVSSSMPGCLEGFEEGKAIIKVVEMSTGKIAMVVAGMTALDTRRAARVLKNYEDYNLDGDEMEVTGTSLEDITVNKIV